MDKVTRIGVSLEPELLEAFDKFIAKHGYTNRSEAVRDMIRETLATEEWTGSGNVIGTITMVYDHDAHHVVDKLTKIQHRYHHNVHSTTHVHLDAHECLEVIVVQGNPEEITRLSDSIKATKGVKHAQLARTASGK
jgi:CopG family nickel-responsive transcriptional regulator